MKIYLIRHGLTELNKRKLLNGQIDEPLAPEGFQQARVATPLIPKTVKRIYTSSMLRAMQTAETINAVLGLPLTSQHELREMHMGAVAGWSWDEMASGQELKNKHRSMQFDYRNEGGESADEFKKRIVTFLESINRRYNSGEVLIVTHGGVVRLLHLLNYGTENHKELEHVSLLEFDVDKILKNYQRQHKI